MATALPTVSAPWNEPAVLRRHPILMPLAMTPLPQHQLASKDLPLRRDKLFDTRSGYDACVWQNAEQAVLREHPILMPFAMTPLQHQQLASKDLPLEREYRFDTRAD